MQDAHEPQGTCGICHRNIWHFDKVVGAFQDSQLESLFHRYCWKELHPINAHSASILPQLFHNWDNDNNEQPQ